MEIRDAGTVITGLRATVPPVLVFPNPSTAMHFAAPEATGAGSYRYRVLNAFGQVVRTAQASGEALQAGITLEGLPAGSYLLEVQAAAGTSRVIKHVEVR
nr:T9SS type A sorting domain-containing protein [Hymenobacter ruricola]